MGPARRSTAIGAGRDAEFQRHVDSVVAKLQTRAEQLVYAQICATGRRRRRPATLSELTAALLKDGGLDADLTRALEALQQLQLIVPVSVGGTRAFWMKELCPADGLTAPWQVGGAFDGAVAAHWQRTVKAAVLQSADPISPQDYVCATAAAALGAGKPEYVQLVLDVLVYDGDLEELVMRQGRKAYRALPEEVMGVRRLPGYQADALAGVPCASCALLAECDSPHSPIHPRGCPYLCLWLDTPSAN